MPKVIDLKGKQYGKLTVLEYTGTSKDRSSVWKCQCACGTIKTVSSRDLRQNKTKSCGCLVHENVSARLRPFEAVFNRIAVAASAKKIVSNLTYEDYLNFTKIPNCHYCDVSIPWLAYAYEGGKTSIPYFLDRKDNDKDYTLDNCVVCCTKCNRGKMHQFSYEEWKEIGALLKAIRNKENYAYIHQTRV